MTSIMPMNGRTKSCSFTRQGADARQPRRSFRKPGSFKADQSEAPGGSGAFRKPVQKRDFEILSSAAEKSEALEQYIAEVNLNPHYGGKKIMSNETRKAILAVSFGTSHNDTREVTIDAIERDMQQAFPHYPLYRAWTSKMIIKKVNKRDNIHINTVKEAMEQMRADGITDVLVQPTHVINGIENDLMKEDALSYQEYFHSISFGDPLLTSEQDNLSVIQLWLKNFPT